MRYNRNFFEFAHMMYQTKPKGSTAMPKIYLSPSAQEFNHYVDGGNEEYYMNLIADAMEPYLTASGIDFSRNQPEMPLWKIINDANGQDYNLHLAIHSNASPDAQAGKNTGVQIYYYPTSERGKRFAEIIAENYRPIYREPMNIKLVPNANLAELRKTKAPAVLIETAYHDNRADARWIRDNLDNIARALSKSVAQYLNVPFKEP